MIDTISSTAFPNVAFSSPPTTFQKENKNSGKKEGVNGRETKKERFIEKIVGVGILNVAYRE
jgi:hypothetical protein